ncbi:MAG: ribonuclease R [Tissierellia bacterium]|nr:ribonuclease R [Tissierellia bacterium]
MKKIILKGKIKINKNGFGFFTPENEEFDDVFIPKNGIKKALNNDIVMVRVVKEKDSEFKAEGVVIDVVERSNSVMVGRFEKVKNFGFVILDGNYNYDVFVATENVNGAKDGDKVVVELIDFTKKDKNPTGKITEILGKVDDVGIEVLAIAKKFELPTEFSKDTLDYARSLPNSLSKDDYDGRTDFRDLFTVTIDGADAKDFDDAISIEKEGENYALYVHIADVAHYVREKTDINNDAYERGNSVYLLDRVIPMLPEELSNNLCSLNPHVDRLVLTVKMVIDKKGKVLEYEFFEAVINSDHRLIYDDVSDYLEGKEHILKDDKLLNKLDMFNELHVILMDSREAKGDIDFNFKETKIVLDQSGHPIEIGIAERRVSNMIIESFMVITNEVVGSHFANLDVSFVYRAHEKPTEEKEAEFRKMVAKFGFVIRGRELYPKDYQNILKEVEGEKIEMMINNLMLRSLSKADYRREPSIHFGLATENYSHFTAPIRRYSDLIVHRILKNSLHGIFKKETKNYHNKLDEICEHISITERQAESAEREVEDLKKCEYMLDKVGNEYHGVISSLTNFGFFVELDNTVDGLIHFRELDGDYYEFDEEQYAIIGENTGKRYELGQDVRIIVEKVNVELREIDFGLVEDDRKG